VKPARFQYHRPTTTAEAAALLAEHGDEAKVLAGGQSLVPILAMRLSSFGHLVDLNAIAELQGISSVNGHLRIGAMTRQSAAEHSAQVAAAVPLLAKAIPHIGHFQIRNRGTVGGSIAHADPASELPAVALALDAIIDATSASGTRRVNAGDLFESTWTTSLADGEILTAVSFPKWSGQCGFSVQEIARRHGDFALAGVVCGIELDGDKVKRAAIALFGVGTTPIRATAAEQALVSGSSPTEAGAIASSGLDPTGDVHASASYRKKVSATLVQRAVNAAIEEARRG
jgi:aerobic carbon-monoxide dehydrogenase medium subunit